MLLYRVIVLRAGAEISAKGYYNRAQANAAYAKAVSRCFRQSKLYRVPFRVELWRGETLIENVDTAGTQKSVQPRA